MVDIQNKRILSLVIGAVICLTITAGALAWSLWGNRFQVVITEQQIVDKLHEKFPFRKTFFRLLDLTLQDPEILLEEGSNRVAFGLEIQTNIRLAVNGDPYGPLIGRIKLSGLVRYDANTAQFFLDEPRVERLEIQNVPESWSERLNQAATKAVSEILSRAPIYRLNSADLKQAAARVVLRDVVVKDKKVFVTLGMG